MDSIKNYLVNQDKKEWIFLSMVGAVILVLILLFMRGNEDAEREEVLMDESEIASTAQHVSLRKYFTEQIGKKIERQGAEYIEAKEEFEKKHRETQSEMELIKKDNEILQESLLKLKFDFEQSQQNIHSSVSSPMNEPQYNEYQYDLNNSILSPPIVDELETVSVELEDFSPSNSKALRAANYVASGTHIKGVLLGGIDAHTEVYGNNETRVVTIRMVEDGVMPNGFKAPLKNCVLLASAWGNASSERVAMRGERLSCIQPDGQVFEQDIVGIVYGPDGREDVRGRVVYPEGKLVQRAFIAGSLSGLGAGVSENFVTKSISPLGATSTVNAGDMLGYSAAQGANKGLDKLADYYIKRAEKLQPIVQVPAGVLVDVVIQKGFSISPENKTKEMHKNNREQDSVKKAHAQALDVLGKFSETYHD